MLVIAVMAAGLATPATAHATSDPWESFNTQVFRFNKALDDKVLRPTAQTYVRFMPGPARRGVNNFFSNLNDVTVLVNNVLQGKFADAASDTGRIFINTTLGVGGLMDLATGAGFYKNHEDFGQTLGVWGVRPGPYLVLPIFGPSTVRDSIGFATDIVTGPVHSPDDVRLRNSLHTLNLVDTRASSLQLDALISGDEYLFVREAYLQQREYMVRDGQMDDQWDDWDDWD